MYQSEPVDSKKILFVKINLNEDYEKSDENFNSNQVKISSMSIFNNNIYISETYHNILSIYKININKNKINKKLYFRYVFPKEEKIEGFAMDEDNIYLGLDTDFLPYKYNLIKIIKPN